MSLFSSWTGNKPVTHAFPIVPQSPFAAIASLICLLTLLVMKPAASAATLAELKTQLATAECSFATVYATKDAMVAFTNNYPTKLASLQQAYSDLQTMETTLRTLLRNNLVKSTILLSYETFKTINDTASLASSTITDLISDGLSHAVQNYAWDKFKDGLTGAAKDKMGIGDQDAEDMRSPYTVQIRSLKASTLVLMPDIQSIQTILRMSLEDIKARAVHDDGTDLNETGCIYRKYQMLLDAIVKAQTGLYQMRQQLTQAQQAIADQLPQVETERIRLGTVCSDLRNQIGAIHTSQQASVGSTTLSNYDAVIPPLTVQDLNVTLVPPETQQEFLLRHKHLVETYVAQQFASYKNQSDSLVAEIDQKITAFTNHYGLYFSYDSTAGWRFSIQFPIYSYLALGNDRETLDISTVSTVRAIVENHKRIKDAYDALIAAAGPAASALGQAETDLLAILGVFESLKTVDANITELYRIGINASAEVAEAPNLPANIANYRYVSENKGVRQACQFLGIIRDHQSQAATAIATLDMRRKNYEATVDTTSTNGVQSIYAMELAESQYIQDLLTQCEQARVQLLARAAEYSQLIYQNRFLSQSPINEGSFYPLAASRYADGTNGITIAIQYYYSQYYLQKSISSALAATNGHSGADPIWFAYDGVVNSYRDINRRYSEAAVKFMQLYNLLENYYGYSVPQVAVDLSQAAAAGGYLTIVAPNLQELDRRFRAVTGIKYYELGSLAALPDTEDDITTLTVYRLYQLKKKVALNSPAWLALWPAEFDVQYRQCTNESAAIRALPDFAYFDGWLKANEEISALNMLYDVTNPPPTITVIPQSGLMISNGTRVTLTLGATCPNPISYQWYWGALNDFSYPIPFANGPSYTTPAIFMGQSFNCFVKLSSRSHTPYVTAGNFNVLVDPASVIGPGGPGGGGPGGGGPGFTNSTSLPFNTLSNWAVTCNLPADKQGNNDDPAHIGLPNRIAYALGLNPYSFNPQLLPKFTLAPIQAEMRFTRPANTIGYVYSIQSSGDLTQWNNEILNKVNDTGTNETWSVTLPRTNGMRFLRFMLSQ